MYELLVEMNGQRKTVRWDGSSGEDAAQRYADVHRGVTVVAWRENQSAVLPLGTVNQIRG